MTPIYGFDDSYQLARWQAERQVADDLPPILRRPNCELRTRRARPDHPRAAAAVMTPAMALALVAVWRLR